MEYEEAKKRVKALKGFYIHFLIYCVVIAGLFGIDYLDGGGWWFYYPAVGWGIAVAIHAVAMVFDVGFLGTNWEEKKIKQFMGKA